LIRAPIFESGGRINGGLSTAAKAALGRAADHIKAGRLAEAERALRDALRIAPDSLECQVRLAQFLSRIGDHAGAAELFGRVVAAQPALAAAHSDLGNALFHLGRVTEAEAAHRRALAIAPGHPGYLINLAVALQALGQLEAAAETCREALVKAPGLHHAHLNMGVILEQQGRKAEAAAHIRRAYELEPRDPRVLTNLGNSELAHGRAAEAEALQRQALQLAPGFAEAEANLGAALLTQDRFVDAEHALRRAIALQPGLADAYRNLGIALEQQGRFDEALQEFDRALAHDASNAEAHVARAMALLRRGDFTPGWAEYAWRWRTREARTAARVFDRPPWNGEALDGLTILLHAEQGMGDTIQFLRYVPMVAARGACVILEVQAPLKPLCAGLAGTERVIAAGESLPPHDRHCPLLDLPRIFGTTIDTIPAVTPYIEVDPQRAALWRPRIERRHGVKVGLVWAGNPDFRDDRRRSIPPEALAPLFAVPGITFFALQVGARAHDLAPIRQVETLGAELRDFADTAACVHALDLVIAVDTAVAHLAAALGRRTLILLPKVADWRWLVDRGDSPWYPFAALFRQKQPGDWTSTVECAARELAANANG
jgi:Flp pilus assembly protein TadD